MEILLDGFWAKAARAKAMKYTDLCYACAAGHVDADTREWTDGVLTAAARAVAKQPLEQRSWIVCDGDVDPEWIESLNSVLDDNRQDAYWLHVKL